METQKVMWVDPRGGGQLREDTERLSWTGHVTHVSDNMPLHGMDITLNLPSV